MHYSNADPRVLGYLGRALSLELSAVQLYSTQARLVSAWGLVSAAEHLKKDALEEMGHADRIIGRMLALGAAPNASQLRPVKLGNNMQDLLQHNHAFENELVNLYEDAVRYCVNAGDQDSRIFFQALLDEERAHANQLEQSLADLGLGVKTDTANRITF